MRLAFLALATLTACAVGQPYARPVTGLVVLRGVRVIDGQGGPALEDQSIVLDGDRIREVGPRATLVVPARARIVELDGKTVFPGLVSDHSHLGLTDGTASGAGHYTRENVRRQLHQFVAYGVTTICSLGFNPTLFYELQREVRGLPYADLFGADRGIGVPGGAPPVNVGADQLYRPSTPDEARAAVREMAARHPTFIKIWVDDFHGTLPKKMSPDVYRAVIDEAHRAGLRVAAHVYYLEDARNLVDADVDVLAHGVRDREVDDAFGHEMKRKHVWYVATLELDESGHIFALAPAWTTEPFVRHALQPAVQVEIDDPAWRQKILGDHEQVEAETRAVAINQHNLERLFALGVPIGFGTDSGATPLRVPGFAEHRELELMVQAGLTPLEAIHAATHDAAELLGLHDRGTIAPGQLADLVVVDGKPDANILDTRRIVSVWKRGIEIAGGVRAFEPVIAVVMGVAGSGKSVVGRALAEQLGWAFADGDDFHSPANVDKMHAGHALTDADRGPWLHALRVVIDRWRADDTDAVLACSALKRAYRDVLRTDGVRFVYLDVDRATLEQRLTSRVHAFMPAALLDSQLAALEVPTEQEALRVDGTRPVREVVDSIARALTDAR